MLDERTTTFAFRKLLCENFAGLNARLCGAFVDTCQKRAAALVQSAFAASYSKHVMPHAINWTRSNLRRRAEQVSLELFAHNMKRLLLLRPLGKARMLAIDPGFYHGCKSVVLDERGEVLQCIMLSLGQKDLMQQRIIDAIRKHALNKVVIGNGTASFETRQVVADALAKGGVTDVEFSIVSECGASVYSASPVANEELRDLDILFRGACPSGAASRTLFPSASKSRHRV